MASWLHLTLVLGMCITRMYAAPSTEKNKKQINDEYELGKLNDDCPVLQCMLQFQRTADDFDNCSENLSKARSCSREASVCGCSEDTILGTMDRLGFMSCGCRWKAVRDCVEKDEELMEALIYTPVHRAPPLEVRRKIFEPVEKCHNDMALNGLDKKGCEDQFQFPQGEFMLLAGKAWSNGCDNIKTILVDCDYPLEFGCGPGQEAMDEFLRCTSRTLTDPACKSLIDGFASIKAQIVRDQQDLCAIYIQTEKKASERCDVDDNVTVEDYLFLQ